MRGIEEIKAANRNPRKFAETEMSDGDVERNAAQKKPRKANVIEEARAS